jgi:hypothetical protein
VPFIEILGEICVFRTNDGNLLAFNNLENDAQVVFDLCNRSSSSDGIAKKVKMPESCNLQDGDWLLLDPRYGQFELPSQN